MIVGISGIIGAGKSTLVRNLSSVYSIHPVYEPVDDNPYLQDFYQDMKSWSFHMQMFLLSARFRQYVESTRKYQDVILDRTLYEDKIFASMLYNDGMLSLRDYTTYLDHFDQMCSMIRYPDLLIHLDISPEGALDRIRKRGRVSEQSIPLDYLKSLDRGYSEFIQDIRRFTRVEVLPVLSDSSESDLHTLMSEISLERR